VFTAAALILGALAIRQADDLERTHRWLVAATFFVVTGGLLASRLRAFGSDPLRERIGRTADRAYLPLTAVTAVLASLLGTLGQSSLLATASGAMTSTAALAAYGLVRDIGDRTNGRG
jgi:uncharacterized membrane protein